MESTHTYAVIMAGGIGTRFWPQSRKKKPKQFQNVFGQTTLIQETVARLSGVIPPERCLIVTNERYVELVQQQLPRVPSENILAEPISRNTAPCITYAARVLHDRDPGSTMVVLPSDHVIKHVGAFHKVLHAAIQKAQEPGALVTIGITPTHPATGYGYIQHDRQIGSDLSDDIRPHPVRTFAEKPDLETAERFLDSGDFLWNSGMFIWRADSIITNVEQLLPSLHDAFAKITATASEHDITHAFQESPSISIDYGVMERAHNVFVVPGSFGWSDVGDWQAVYDQSEKDQHGNAVHGEVLLEGSSRCYVQALDKLIVLIGMQDTVVVESSDAILICKRDKSQKVKEVVNYLQAHQQEKYL